MNCGLQAGKKQMLVCRWICSFFWLSQGTSRGTARSLAIAASALKPQQTSQRLKEFGRRKSSNFFLCSRICVPSRLDASQNVGYLPTLIQLTLFTGAVCPSNVKIQVPIIVSIKISAVFMQAKIEEVNGNKRDLWQTARLSSNLSLIPLWNRRRSSYYIKSHLELYSKHLFESW